MSTDLTSLTPAGGAPLPAAFQGKTVAKAFQDKTDLEKGSEGIEGGYPILKYAGKVWSLQYRGENRKFLRPDGDGPRGSIDMVFTRISAAKAKTFYPPGFKDGSREKPICWSNDGARPDPAVPPSQKQAPACAACPKNAFGSRITDDGKQAKACGDHKRTAVIIDPNLVSALLGMTLSEPVLLRIPAASLVDYGTFCDTMDAQGYPVQSIVTKVSFDPAKNYPKFKFEAVRPLNDAEGDVARAIRTSPAAERIIADTGNVADGADDAMAGADQAVGATVVQNGPNLGTGAGQGQPAESQTQHNATVVQMPVAPRAEALNPNPPQTLTGPTAVQAERLTPEQQAQQMAAQTHDTPVDPAAAGFDDDINARISKLLG